MHHKTREMLANALYAQLVEMDENAGNQALRKATEIVLDRSISDADYAIVRDYMVDEEWIGKGGGRGGSVYILYNEPLHHKTREKYAKVFLELLDEQGGVSGNISLWQDMAEVLDCEISDYQYNEVRDHLLEQGSIEKGGGRGGSVRRLYNKQTATPSRTPTTTATPSLGRANEGSQNKSKEKAKPQSKLEALASALLLQLCDEGSSLDDKQLHKEIQLELDRKISRQDYQQVREYLVAEQRIEYVAGNGGAVRLYPDTKPKEPQPVADDKAVKPPEQQGNTPVNKDNTTTDKVTDLTHGDATRANIPTAEYQQVMANDATPVQVAYKRRNPDLDPQLVWRGKDINNDADLLVNAPPLYIQEKVHPKALIDDLRRQSENGEDEDLQLNMFADFNGLPSEEAKTEFYQHKGHWQNRMILGDSLQVMASLAEREGLRGQVQCIYIDPPYGIKFNSNFQWSTTSRDVKDKAEHITREPEQVKAFRDTWRDGIHTYLSYLRDRLVVARDLLTESGSVFVQIGDENVHRVRALMDEVFGEDNLCAELVCRKTSALNSPSASVSVIPSSADYILWYSKKRESVKYRQPYLLKQLNADGGDHYRQVELEDGETRPLTKFEVFDSKQLPLGSSVFRLDNLISQGFSSALSQEFIFQGKTYLPGKASHWKTTSDGLRRLYASNRISSTGRALAYRRKFNDFQLMMVNSIWQDVGADSEKTYVVQTPTAAIRRCILMTTDPGDIVFDPTCGSGTTAYVAEQWGRRWITADTSRVALALTRARIMGARYPYYLLADSYEGQTKEAQVTHNEVSTLPVRGDIRQGFVYQRVPHITLKSIANNTEIDVIWDQSQLTLEPLREQLNTALDEAWQEWEIPREPGQPWESDALAAFEAIRKEANKKKPNGKKIQQWLEAINTARDESYTLETLPEHALDDWADDITELHSQWWQARIARQQAIDDSIAAKAEFEYLYDKPYEDKKRVRVAGPFTVESVSPHRAIGLDENDELIDPTAKIAASEGQDFAQLVLENLRTSGVQQNHKDGRLKFTSLESWPGSYICAVGNYAELSDADADTEDLDSLPTKRAGVFVGPEFGTVARPDLIGAAREASDAGLDVLIVCAFSYDAHANELDKLGPLRILKARMNADLHMGGELKNTGAGNLFVIFGEPDIDLINDGDEVQVKINGVDVFHPASGEVRSDNTDGIACWFIDTDYNEESFFVRHAYFLGQNDPYKSLKTSLKAEIDEEAWASLNSDISRPFKKPRHGRIAVKVINHLGDEVMKVFRVD